MNIVEAYLKFNKQCIILVSGLSGSGKKEIAKDIEKSISFKLINTEKYYKSIDDYKVFVDVGDIKILDWDSIEAVNWDLVNNEIKEHKSRGVVVVGNAFPKGCINEIVDIHFHVKIAKQTLLTNRKQYIEEHKFNRSNSFNELNESNELLVFNKITYPHYFEYLEKSNITMVLNLNNSTILQLQDEAFKYIMEFISKSLNSLNSLNSSNSLKSKSSNSAKLQSYPQIVDDSSSSEKGESSSDYSTPSDKRDKEIYLGTFRQ